MMDLGQEGRAATKTKAMVLKSHVWEEEKKKKKKKRACVRDKERGQEERKQRAARYVALAGDSLVRTIRPDKAALTDPPRADRPGPPPPNRSAAD
ncbi:hypothetical protein DIZ76_013692 [Coccidioides immitis]|nr:hypothetical protein DIZ76_013692 [Coccidioides immitis]